MREIREENNEYFFRMFDQLLKELKQTEDYRNDSEEAEKIEDKYPIIRNILEGTNIGQECLLSVEMQAAIKEYVELRVNMQEDLQIKYYLRGYHDCILLLIRCGLLK